MILIPLLNLALRRLLSAVRNRAVSHGGVGNRLRRLRRELLPTREELDRQYLDEAQDLYDLEQRMRELDRPRRPAYEPGRLSR
jgi:hypothetical protein